MKNMKKSISKYLKGKKGFTLVELITAMAVLSILMTAYFSLFFAGGKTYGLVYDGYKTQNEARIAMSYITVKIRKNDRIHPSDPAINAVSVDEVGGIKHMYVSGDTGDEYIYAFSAPEGISLKTADSEAEMSAGNGTVIAEGLVGITMKYPSDTETDKIIVEIEYNNGGTNKIEETIVLRSQP